MQEETTFGGSRTSAFALAPDAAIVIDVTHATDAPGIEVKPSGKHALGSGPVIGRGSTLHAGVFELLYETGRAEEIPFTIEASGRSTGTDADAVHASRAGVPTGLVIDPRALHALAGRDGRPARRAGHRPPAGRGAAGAERRPGVPR